MVKKRQLACDVQKTVEIYLCKLHGMYTWVARVRYVYARLNLGFVERRYHAGRDYYPIFIFTSDS